MSLLRNPQIYPPICSMAKTGDEPLSGFAPGPHRLDESAAGYSLAGCAPAEPASASPGDYEYALQSFCWSRSFHPTVNSVLTVCVRLGGKCSGIRIYARNGYGQPLVLLGQGCVEMTIGKIKTALRRNLTLRISQITKQSQSHKRTVVTATTTLRSQPQ